MQDLQRKSSYDWKQFGGISQEQQQKFEEIEHIEQTKGQKPFIIGVLVIKRFAEEHVLENNKLVIFYNKDYKILKLTKSIRKVFIETIILQKTQIQIRKQIMTIQNKQILIK